MVPAAVHTELTGSSDMLKFMEDALREVCTITSRSTQRRFQSQRARCSGMQLEQAQGCVDLQARAQLDRLRQQTASLSKAELGSQAQAAATSEPIDELAIAGQLDK